ncbi:MULTISPECIES: phosphonate ABC transporter, permease protein PhnE [Halobellus]|uniref:phosphonate ABC transporter, permease protein PhnE n=1 Tax=Halobellus TaxID=1073986 RepID=UPI000EF286E1|nr:MULTISPECIES: phosphonate ABC transporter, permease protein PhnE [Halobellus]MDQ2055690.1 phosphonate ABC transporter, permease protein PhnE [Halobellus sp. H-GB7]RLM90409.1 phosphonate ABC transporter, permease protein PhnE [Halobellus sp. Atlit-38R]
MATEQSDTRSWQRPTAFYNRYVKWAVYVVIGAFLLWSAWNMRISPARAAQGWTAAAELLGGMFPPEFTPFKTDLLIQGLIESLAMSVVATIIGVILSIPVAFMAAENIAPQPVYWVGRGIITVSRAFHELIIAIIAVKAVGIGALAGVIALSYKTVGFFAKLLAEDIEDIDAGQMEAVEATGANQTQTMLFGVVPQVMPRVVGLTIYRWDINIRHSTIVGIVGAGGIGSTLLNSFDKYDYDFFLTIVLAIIAIVMVGEFVSTYIRGRIQ